MMRDLINNIKYKIFVVLAALERLIFYPCLEIERVAFIICTMCKIFQQERFQSLHKVEYNLYILSHYGILEAKAVSYLSLFHTNRAYYFIFYIFFLRASALTMVLRRTYNLFFVGKGHESKSHRLTSIVTVMDRQKVICLLVLFIMFANTLYLSFAYKWGYLFFFQKIHCNVK